MRLAYATTPADFPNNCQFKYYLMASGTPLRLDRSKTHDDLAYALKFGESKQDFRGFRHVRGLTTATAGIERCRSTET